MTATDKAVERQQSQAVDGQAKPMEERPVFWPATDVYERDDALVLLADMPGVGESDVELHLENDVLTIRGTTTFATEEGQDVLYSEFTHGTYERVFTLSQDVDRDHIKASMKNGVLRVTLPKAEQAKPRKISVQVE